MTIWAVLGRFCHGLVFFTLSLTIRFLHYRSRRIVLARHLPWLGGFATCEAIFAWYALLLILMPGGPAFLTLLPLLILGVGYTYLLAFGLQTMMSEVAYARSFKPLLLGVVVAWVVPYGIAIVTTTSDWPGMAAVAETALHFGLALPGSLLTAIGLRRQSYQSLDMALRRRIRPYLRIFEISMVMFALLNSIVVPRPFGFLVPYLDVTHLNDSLGGWVWSVVGAAMTLGLVQSLTTIQREIEMWVEGVERLQALAEDRERIGRELHDGIIQSIYAAGLLLEGIQAVIPNDPARDRSQSGRIMENLTRNIQPIRLSLFD